MQNSNPIGLVISILIIWVLSAFMRLISPEWFGAMPLLGISWISIVTSTLLGVLTVLLAARSPAKRAAKVSPLTAVSGNAGQTVFFRRATNVSLFKIETALGVHHAKARKKNYILMTGAFAVLVYGFLSIIVAITVFHIMNTIGMGIAAKMKEYGGMRAIGMSSRQLIRMIIAEAGTYAISGIIWGCIMGIPMHWVIYTSMVTNFWGDIWSVPFIPLILIICIVFIALFFAVKKPAKRLQNMSIVENINAQ